MSTKNTRDRLIEVALELFAVNGYEGVSTRQIVDKAGVNISAITYYFGGKEGLYKAVIESKINMFEKKMSSDIINLSTNPPVKKEEQKSILLKLLEKYMDFLFSKGVSQYLVLLLFREMTGPTPVFELFYEKVMGRMHKTFTKLISAVFEKPEDDENMILLTTTIIGQILIFRFGKTIILRRMGMDDYNRDFLSRVKQTILNNVEIIINNWRPL